jgi:hypothetical protein
VADLELTIRELRIDLHAASESRNAILSHYTVTDDEWTALRARPTLKWARGRLGGRAGPRGARRPQCGRNAPAVGIGSAGRGP